MMMTEGEVDDDGICHDAHQGQAFENCGKDKFYELAERLAVTWLNASLSLSERLAVTV